MSPWGGRKSEYPQISWSFARIDAWVAHWEVRDGRCICPDRMREVENLERSYSLRVPIGCYALTE